MYKNKGWFLFILGITTGGINLIWGEELLSIPLVRYLIGFGSIAIFFVGLVYLIVDWFRFKPRQRGESESLITHINVSRVYYKKLPMKTNPETGKKLYQLKPWEFISEGGLSSMGLSKRYLILQLNIVNRDTIENRLTDCIVDTGNLKTDIVDLFGANIDEYDLGFYHTFKQVDNIYSFHIPLALEPNQVYTRYLCLKFLDDVALVEGQKVEITILDMLGKKCNLENEIGMENGKAFLRK